ncbi:MAG: hypothetical protein ACC682_08890, partial [Gemmatimonadota bacterium]
ELVTLSIHGRWWVPRVRLLTNSLRALEGLPGFKRGRVDLRIARRNRAGARTLVAEFEIARADFELRRARQFESFDAEFLAP